MFSVYLKCFGSKVSSCLLLGGHANMPGTLPAAVLQSLLECQPHRCGSFLLSDSGFPIGVGEKTCVSFYFISLHFIS